MSSGLIINLNINWILDVDVNGGFDNIDHSFLREFIQKRVNDGGVKRLIEKLLDEWFVEEVLSILTPQCTGCVEAQRDERHVFLTVL